MKKNRQLLFLHCSIFLTIFIGCQSQQVPTVRNQFLFGTYFSLTVYDSENSRLNVETVIDTAIARATALEGQLNPYDETSLIARLNAKPTETRHHPLDPNLSALVKSAIDLAGQSAGAFDFTLWPVFKLWHFDTDSASVPALADINNARNFVDYRRITLDESLLIIPPGSEIDFGAISKGYAVEIIRQSLKDSGLQRFIIDMGGNLGIEWQGQEPIDVLIRHPRKNGQFYGKITVNRSCGIATSGDYHFYFESEGQRYHHILDPQTGYPAKNVVSATVVAPTATLADGLSTSVFVMGREKGMQFIQNTPGVEGLMLSYGPDSSLTHLTSSGLANIFTPQVQQ